MLHYNTNMDFAKSQSYDYGLQNRRIMSIAETRPETSDFSQTIDVDLDIPGDGIRSLPNMPGYFIRSPIEAIKYTKQLVSLGINTVTYRLGGGLNKENNKGYAYAPLLINTELLDFPIGNEEFQIEKHAEFYSTVRSEFLKEELYIVADPFGLAPNLADGAWGARNQSGALDFNKTAWLLAHLATKFANAGVNAILTMGRIEYEIEISRLAIDKTGKSVQLFSFSQNNESKAAYVYLEKLGKPDSFQKIIPGNITEMKVRTILDIYGGTDAIIIKPSDNLHVIQFTVDYLEDPMRAINYLKQTLNTNFYNERQDIRSRVVDVLNNVRKFEERSQSVRVGTYTVSGTYFMDKLLEREKGAEYLFNVEDERFKNILSIISKRRAPIIDRSAEWYLRHLSTHVETESLRV